jgi:hypothetical protein
MAAVTLTHLWLHDAADPSVYVKLRLHELSATPARRAEAREYAAGRVRKISRPTRRQTIAFDCRLVDRSTITQLEEWAGRTLMLRDPRGRKAWGFYEQVEVGEHRWTERGDVHIDFEVISHVEAV